MFSLPRRLRPVGPQGPAARAVEPLQRRTCNGRARARLPALATGPSSTSGSTSREEELEIPSIYFAHEREVFERDGMIYAVSDFVELMHGEEPFTAAVRYRTVGDMSCTGGGPVDRRDARRGRRRDRRHADHRARRDPRRRPRLGGRDGGPQARGLLLELAPPQRQVHVDAALGAAARRDRGLGRRRQVDADRPAALRLQAGPPGPARARRASLRARAATATSTSPC